MAGVRYRKVSKRFADGTLALADFDLAVADGELMVLVGPSGCGKSTALRLLAGLEPPSSGDICIDGEAVNQVPPQQRNVAMVFQNYALYPHLTVQGNLAFPLKMMRLPRAEIQRRVQQAAQLLQLGDWLQRKPAELSGGQRQRVAMGRAIVREPRVFLMDEPLSNLDASLRVQIRTEIAALQRRTGITTLYVTHDQVEAMSLGHRVAVLRAGRIQQVATPRLLYERPANSFVAAFLGSPGMNLFPASLRRHREQLQIRLAGHSLVLPQDMRVNRGRLAALADQPLTVGLRPEAFRATDNDDGLGVAITGVETLGHEQLVYFSAPWSGDRPLVARLQGSRLTGQADLKLALDTTRLYFFLPDGTAVY